MRRVRSASNSPSGPSPNTVSGSRHTLLAHLVPVTLVSYSVQALGPTPCQRHLATGRAGDPPLVLATGITTAPGRALTLGLGFEAALACGFVLVLLLVLALAYIPKFGSRRPSTFSQARWTYSFGHSRED